MKRILFATRFGICPNTGPAVIAAYAPDLIGTAATTGRTIYEDLAVLTLALRRPWDTLSAFIDQCAQNRFGPRPESRQATGSDTKWPTPAHPSLARVAQSDMPICCQIIQKEKLNGEQTNTET